MAIVKHYMSGSTEIVIRDTAFVKTKEEQDKIIEEVSRIFSKYFTEHPEHFEKHLIKGG